MCCLGFASEQCGVPRSDLLGVATPSRLGADNVKLIMPLLARSPNMVECLETIAMSLNDDDTIDDDTRERKLSALFAHFGHTMTFVD